MGVVLNISTVVLNLFTLLCQMKCGREWLNDGFVSQGAKGAMTELYISVLVLSCNITCTRRMESLVIKVTEPRRA